MSPRRVPPILVLLLAVLAVHSGGVRLAPPEPARGFVYDDEAVILLNRESLLDPSTAWRSVVEPSLFNGEKGNPMFRPVAHASHVMDAAISGWGEGGPPVRTWRLTNLLLHAAASAVLFLLLRRVLRALAPPGEGGAPGAASGPDLAALLGALWFGLQPVNAEVVLYVTARSESLAALFFLLALLAHHAAHEEGRTGRGRALLVAASVLAALLSHGSKETGILLPAVAAALEVLGRAGPEGAAERARRASLRILPLAGAGVLYALARAAAMPPSRFEGPVLGGLLLGAAGFAALARAGAARPAVWKAAGGVALAGACGVLGWLLLSAGSDPGVDPFVGGGRSAAAHLLTQARVAAACGLLLLFPVDLAPDHGVRVATALDAPTLAALLLLAGAAALAIRAALRGSRAVPLAALWSAAAAAPSFLVPLNVVMNEHRLYLPATGLALGAGLLLQRAVAAGGERRRAAAGAAVAAVFCAFALVDGDRARTWSDPGRLWEEATRTSPSSWRSHLHDGVQRLRTALATKAEGEASGDPVGRSLGTRSGRDQMEQALASCRAAQEIHPRSFETRLNLAFLHLERARAGEGPGAAADFREAIRWFTLAEESSPGSFRALYNRATAMAEAGMVPEATAEFERLSKDPSRTALYAWPLADLYRRAGRWEDALRQLDRAEEVSPGDAGVAALKRGEVLAQAGRFEEGKAAIRGAARLLPPGDPRPRIFMARLLEASGSPEDVRTARALR
ncbi:MAG: tetratricopeptide repeat protein [Planctomycetes bacterium]|nr:tetratricopeptide repeat protein [Planctomycetota bacterium]